MNRTFVYIVLIFLLLLSACVISPASSPVSVYPHDTPPTLTPEPTTNPTPQNGSGKIVITPDYGEISFPFEYDSFFPCTQGFSRPEYSFGVVVKNCDVLLLPTKNEPAIVCSLQKGDCVEVLAKIAQTWDDYKNVYQSWYMVGTSGGLWGWIKTDELEACEAPETFNSLRYKYSQGIVIDGCELSILPGEAPAWALNKNRYVEILAATTLEEYEETWLYVYMGSYTQFHNCLWVRADEIKQYTRENMYDIVSGLSLVSNAIAYYENGTTYFPSGNEELSITAYEENGTIWLGSIYVTSFEDIAFPEPIE